MLVPKVAESLAGRVEILNLFPFSQNELNQSEFNLVDILFDEKIKLPGKSNKSKVLIDRIILGGYPEVQTRKQLKEEMPGLIHTLLLFFKEMLESFQTLKE